VRVEDWGVVLFEGPMKGQGSPLEKGVLCTKKERKNELKMD